jgi:Domain of Unknown Function (DUF1206)
MYSTKIAPAREARAGGEKLAQSRGFEWLARAGFVARGLIYGLVGILALEVAVGAGGKTTDQEGALKTIAGQPFGEVLLTLVAIGLAGYALWRLVRALLGHGPEGSDSTFDRVAALGSGLVYAGLCAVAVEILLGAGGSSNTSKTTAGVLGWPAGTWLVGIAGAVLIGVALYQGYRGISRDFAREELDRVDRHLRPPRPHGRLRSRRHLPDQGRRRVRPGQGGRSRRRPRQAGPQLVRALPARPGSGRADRVRPLLAQRRPLPPHLAPPSIETIGQLYLVVLG